ncbi:MAG: NADPH-dependent oxidoreductase [Chlamydiae bacterium]|jgi:chromate reductase|nr:NADPH-dependent oxidoreductase [Chlamydiota bacterium]
MTKILIIPGSLRKESYNKKLAQLVQQQGSHLKVEMTLIDLKEFPLPLFDQDELDAHGFPKNVIKLQELIESHDGVIFITPEYNASISGALKNMIDWTSRSRNQDWRITCYNQKPIGLMSASVSYLGGIRALIHLRQILSCLNAMIIPEEKQIPLAHEVFDQAGQTEKHLQGIDRVIQALVSLIKKSNS